MKELISELFQEQFHSECRYFQAPGRINLIGEHTDYNDGFVLPASINRYVTMGISPSDSQLVQLYSKDYDESFKFQLNSIQTNIPHWAKYIYGVVKEIRKRGKKIPGFNAVFSSDIPIGAGLSSSAAIESAFAYALNTLFKLEFDVTELARIGQAAEHCFVGVKCGIMDQFASLLGKKDHVILLDCKNLEYQYIPYSIDGYSFLLVDSMVKHELASSEYNTRRQECETGLKWISRKYPSVISFRDITSSTLKESKEFLNPIVYNRCSHVVNENKRLHQAVDAIKSRDINSLGGLIYKTHESLQNEFEVSCKELDYIVDISREFKEVIGARMMGGGFGGCVLHLLPNSEVENYKDYVNVHYFEKYKIKPNIYQVSIDDGAKEI